MLFLLARKQGTATPVQPRRSGPVEVRIEEIPARAPAPAIATPAAAAQAKPGKSESASRKAAELVAKPHGPAPTKSAKAELKRDEAWAAAEGLVLPPKSALPVAPFGVTTTLKDPLAVLGPSTDTDRPGAGTFDNGFGQGPQGPVKVLTREEKLAEEKLIVEARVHGWILDAQAFARADPSRDRDGYWQDVQDELVKGFEPDWAMFNEPKPGKSRAPNVARVASEQYMAAAEKFGKTGSPVGRERGQPGVPGQTMNNDLAGALSADRGLAGTVMDTHQAMALQLQNLPSNQHSPWLQRLVVHLLLTQAVDGKLTDVAIAGSSGNPVYDALALGQARKLSNDGLLGPPPKDHLKTIWAFEADFEQAPPMPVAGCQLGTTFAPHDCFYPMKKSIKSRVRLEAVY